jgi:dipeptidyl aminopeptidase/acylaminoacyl peptidase
LICQDISTAQTVALRMDLQNGRTRTLWRDFSSVTIAGASQDHGEMIGMFKDVHTPGNLYRFSTAFERQQRLTDIEPALNNLQAIGLIETIQTQAPRNDGTLMQVGTTILLPPGAKRGDRLPGLVFQYPGLNLSTGATAEFGGRTSTLMPAALFTSRGYAVLLVDAPLSPYSLQGNDPPGNPAQDMADIVVAQVYRAAELGYVDVTRMAVLGHSAGGYSTAAIISKTNLFRAAVAGAGFYDLPGLYTQFLSVVHRRMGTHPWGDLQRYLTSSPYYSADPINTPLLLLHGESDDACPVEEANKLY